MIVGSLMTNVTFLLVGCFGKVGYFPSLIIILLVLYCSSYLLIIYDQIIKRNYLFCYLVINSIAISLYLVDYYAILFNFIVINIFIKFIFTIKHLISISSISLFMLPYLVIVSNELYLVIYLVSYLLLLVLLLQLFLYSSIFHVVN